MDASNYIHRLEAELEQLELEDTKMGTISGAVSSGFKISCSELHVSSIAHVSNLFYFKHMITCSRANKDSLTTQFQ